MQQGRVLNDQRVGLGDRLPNPDRPLVDAAEGDHRRPGALGAEGWKGLRVAALDERRNRKQFGGRDHALTASAVYAHLEHFVFWRQVTRERRSAHPLLRTTAGP